MSRGGDSPKKTLGFSGEPPLHAVLEHGEVFVPLRVLHAGLNAHRQVAASVQRLQTKRVVPVKLPAQKDEQIILIQSTEPLRLQLHTQGRYLLVPHFYNIFLVVIETKVAAKEKKTGTDHFR